MLEAGAVPPRDVGSACSLVCGADEFLYWEPVESGVFGVEPDPFVTIEVLAGMDVSAGEVGVKVFRHGDRAVGRRAHPRE